MKDSERHFCYYIVILKKRQRLKNLAQDRLRDPCPTNGRRGRILVIEFTKRRFSLEREQLLAYCIILTLTNGRAVHFVYILSPMLKTAGFEQTPTMRYVLAAIIVISLIMIALYGVFIEPYQVKLKTVKIQNKALASTLKDLKIVLLSDLHIGDIWSGTVKETLKIIKELKPDLILLTGDYVAWYGKKRAYDNAIDFLSHLSAPLGVYAVMGDADYSFSRKSCEFCHEEGSGSSTTRHRVKFLRDSQVFVENREKKFSIIGIGIKSEHDSNTNEINKMLTDVPAILLSHTSIIYDNIDMDRNILVLSGDTHGGQIYLPDFIWKILKRKADPKHMYGLYQEKNKSLYVTSGIGTSDFPIRLGVPPEVVLFEFKE